LQKEKGEPPPKKKKGRDVRAAGTRPGEKLDNSKKHLYAEIVLRPAENTIREKGKKRVFKEFNQGVWGSQ